jgi:hypothetical protein
MVMGQRLLYLEMEARIDFGPNSFREICPKERNSLMGSKKQAEKKL